VKEQSGDERNRLPFFWTPKHETRGGQSGAVAEAEKMRQVRRTVPSRKCTIEGSMDNNDTGKEKVTG
jgi:hypothetical protein